MSCDVGEYHLDNDGPAMNNLPMASREAQAPFAKTVTLPHGAPERKFRGPSSDYIGDSRGHSSPKM